MIFLSLSLPLPSQLAKPSKNEQFIEYTLECG
jgi:hypothetical protein